MKTPISDQIKEVSANMNRTAIIKPCRKQDYDPDRPAEEQQWCLYTHNGDRLLGRHPTKEKALAQERAVQVHKH